VRASDIQSWLRWHQGVSQNYRVLLFTHVATIFNAALYDKRIWRTRAMPERDPAACGDEADRGLVAREGAGGAAGAVQDRRASRRWGWLWKAEVSGLSPNDLDREAEEINIVRQIRIVENKLVLAPPKRGETCSVPLSRVAAELDIYAQRSHRAR
jgi:hypothetical protein